MTSDFEWYAASTGRAAASGLSSSTVAADRAGEREFRAWWRWSC